MKARSLGSLDWTLAVSFGLSCTYVIYYIPCKKAAEKTLEEDKKV